jgi:hypothetical protein
MADIKDGVWKLDRNRALKFQRMRFFFLEMGGGGEMVDAVKRGKEGKGV